MQVASEQDRESCTTSMKVFSALFYALSSMTIVMVNKTVLSVYSFPSHQVLALGQMAATIMLLGIARRLLYAKFPPLDRSIPRCIWPLPLLHLANFASGLGSTKELNIPMFTVLRRLSILMTMIFEKVLLGIKVSLPVQSSVLGIVAGAVIAAADDLTFTEVGYSLVFINNMFSAASGVYVKKLLDTNDLGMVGLLYYDSFFMFLPAVVLAWATGDLHWTYMYVYNNGLDIIFISNFLLSCCMGVVVSYSVILCTKYNSALTTSVIGSIKNIMMAYVGMVLMNDYVYSWQHFIGLNMSVAACFVYTYVTFNERTCGCAPLLNNPKQDTV